MSELYRLVAHGTDLGNGKTEDRRVGKTPEDVTKLMRQGLERNKENSSVDRLKTQPKREASTSQ